MRPVTFTDRWGVVWRWDDAREAWVEYTHLERFAAALSEKKRD